MNIITNSIKDNLEVQLNKPIDEITTEDLLKIKNITIDKINYRKKIEDVDYDECLKKIYEEYNEIVELH